MADFCAQCSRKMGFPEDDFAGLQTAEDTKRGMGTFVLCGSCGPIMVNHLGECVSPDCPIHGEKSMTNSDSYLGLTVRDEITGFQGVVTAEISYLYGCRQVQITPGLKPDDASKLPDAIWLDRTRVTVLPEFSRIIPREEPSTTGSNGYPPPPSRPAR